MSLYEYSLIHFSLVAVLNVSEYHEVASVLLFIIATFALHYTKLHRAMFLLYCQYFCSGLHYQF